MQKIKYILISIIIISLPVVISKIFNGLNIEFWHEYMAYCSSTVLSAIALYQNFKLHKEIRNKDIASLYSFVKCSLELDKEAPHGISGASILMKDGEEKDVFALRLNVKNNSQYPLIKVKATMYKGKKRIGKKAEYIGMEFDIPANEEEELTLVTNIVSIRKTVNENSIRDSYYEYNMEDLKKLHNDDVHIRITFFNIFNVKCEGEIRFLDQFYSHQPYYQTIPFGVTEEHEKSNLRSNL